MSKALWISVDVESNGPCPGLYSMTSFGAYVVEPNLHRGFGAGLWALHDANIDESAADVGKWDGELEAPHKVMMGFQHWLIGLRADRLIFVSDNPAFDWQFINYYFVLFKLRNPFGHSARRIGDLYAGAVGNVTKSSEWKKLRKTRHTHNPMDDAKGNAEALLQIFEMIKNKEKPCTR